MRQVSTGSSFPANAYPVPQTIGGAGEAYFQDSNLPIPLDRCGLFDLLGRVLLFLLCSVRWRKCIEGTRGRLVLPQQLINNAKVSDFLHRRVKKIK